MAGDRSALSNKPKSKWNAVKYLKEEANRSQSGRGLAPEVSVQPVVLKIRTILSRFMLKNVTSNK